MFPLRRIFHLHLSEDMIKEMSGGIWPEFTFV